MFHQQPFSVIGFHSCNREVGLKALNGEVELQLSTNAWDWLGEGVYFWEQNLFTAKGKCKCKKNAYSYWSDEQEREYNLVK